MFKDSEELQAALATTNEGKRGAESLARMAAALGYKDPLYFGQIDHKCSYGDFLEFLEDFPDVVGLIKDYVRSHIEECEEVDEIDNEDSLEE